MLFDIKQGNESLTSPSGLAWIGLLGLGQPDFAAIEAFRDDPFFRAALHLDQVPPKPRCGNAWTARAAGGLGVWERQSVVSGQSAGLSPLRRGHRLPPGGGERQSKKARCILPSPLGTGEVCVKSQ